jgi:predicted dehydrogenase
VPPGGPGNGLKQVAEAGTVRVGVVGTGFAAGSHIDALRRVPGVELAGVAASAQARADAAADRLGLPRGYGHYNQLLEDPTVEAIHNCTPNDLHLEVNLAALRAGKHLLSEKPLAMDGAQAATLVREASTAGVVAGVCFNYRHFPLIHQARVLLSAGRLGPVHLVHGGYLQDWLLLDTDWNWRVDPARGGSSRAVADIGSHWMDLIQHVTGDRITEVLATFDTVHRVRRRPAGEVRTFAGDVAQERHEVDIGTEDAATVLFRTEAGARGAFTVSQVSAGRKNRLFFEIDAADAALAWDQEEPNRLWIGHRDRANEVMMRDPSLLEPEAAKLAHYPGGHEEGWPDALRNLFADFYATVTGTGEEGRHRPSFATFPEAHRVILSVEAALASHRSGRWEKIVGGEAE